MSWRLSKILLALLPFATLVAEEPHPDDQLSILFGSSGYVLYKVIDFANDHGFRYVKIVSYEFTGFGHEISMSTPNESREGRLFELSDSLSKISFLCYAKKPADAQAIEVEKYRKILDQVESLQDP